MGNAATGPESNKILKKGEYKKNKKNKIKRARYDKNT